ncbi:MAG TPA: ABC transporter ATP-binding protein [Persephonella sp.]|nr:ABC transporter ATP-binding protein [Persephonella sp.]
MENLSWKEILSYIKHYKKQLVLGNVFAILATIINIPIPLFLPLLVDEVLLGKEGVFINTYRALFGEGNAVIYVLVALFLAVFFRITHFIFYAYQVKIFTTISKEITYKIREKVLKHLSKVSMSEFETEGSGKIASKLITDINTIDDFLGKSISKLLISILTIIGVAIVLIFINWKLGLLIVFLNPVVIYFTTLVGKKVGKLKRKENKAIEIFQEALIETLDLFWQIRASNREKFFLSNLIKKAKKVKETSTEFSWKSDSAVRLSALIFLIGYECFRAVAILFVAFSDLSIGMMFATFSYLWVMMTPVQDVLNIQYAFHSANNALIRINEVLRMKLEPNYKQEKNPFKNNTTVSINLKNIWFSYDGKEFILKKVNMHFPKGKKIAIVGASGSGKTTVASIIVGFYPVNKGDVLYDGISVKNIGLPIVRDNVYLVLQNPQIFNNTIRFNLTLGKNISEEEIWKALEIAVLKEVVEKLPNKLDTIVGKNGIKLSGGQKQRLAIARMILARPKVIILDESTSALDYITENKLMENLNKFLKDKTTIIIAHRLSTVKEADYIYVLENGKVIEEGNHEELLKKEGIYSNYIKNFSH